MISLTESLLSSLATDIPAFVRISAAMLLLPGLGETTIPAMVRIGLAGAIALALAPALPSTETQLGAPDITLILKILSELLTGMWFGWLARLVFLALPMAGQYVAYMIGLSNVLQADVDPTAQSSALSVLFSIAAPMLFFKLNLYILPLRAMAELFDLVPIGHVVPAADSAETCVIAVSNVMFLALQLASPFIVISILWNLVVGQMARLGGRMQIYFISFPGQILLGLLGLMLSIEPMLLAWEHYAEPLLRHMPGH